MSTLERELTELLNKWSCEGESDTPDYILAKFLLGCLEAWNKAITERVSWGNKS